MSSDAHPARAVSGPAAVARAREGRVFRGMVRKRAIGDGQLRDLEQHYIQAIYRYNEALYQSPHCASKARREMVRLEVEVRRLRYGY